MFCFYGYGQLIKSTCLTYLRQEIGFGEGDQGMITDYTMQ